MGRGSIYLGKITNPSACELENADVNCDGTNAVPMITPADAQSIFTKFLTQGALPSDSSDKSRTTSSMVGSNSAKKYKNINITLYNTQIESGDEFVVPIIIYNPVDIAVFGFDLLFPSEILEFITFEKEELSEAFDNVDVNRINKGVLRIGGYNSEPIMIQSPTVLIAFVFRVIGEPKVPTSFTLFNTADDFEKASYKIVRFAK